jgi:hypothetical protein
MKSLLTKTSYAIGSSDLANADQGKGNEVGILDTSVVDPDSLDPSTDLDLAFQVNPDPDPRF